MSEHSRVVVHGVRNGDSIAWHIVLALLKYEFEVILGCESSKGAGKVTEMLKEHGYKTGSGKQVRFMGVCNVLTEKSVRLFYERIARAWGSFDGVVHAIAYAPPSAINRPLIEVSQEDYLRAVNVSAYSVIRIARHAVPLMGPSGKIVGLNYEPGTNYIPGYGAMGPAKGAFQTNLRFLGAESCETLILDLPPMRTLSSRGIKGLEELRAAIASSAPQGETTAADVGEMIALVFDPRWHKVTGATVHFDGGAHLLEATRFASALPPSKPIGE